jgi:hypothetical protein
MDKLGPSEQVLWSPTPGRCSQCGLKNDHVRTFSSGDCKTAFCRDCWSGFLKECNMSGGPWEVDVADTWHMDVDLCLEFDGESRGASPRSGFWN